MEATQTKRRRIVVDDSALAASIGGRIRMARRQAGLTQQQLAEGRYTKAYISALEKGHAKPSMAALNFISQRLGTPASRFLADDDGTWERLAADLALASGNWHEAVEAYGDLLDRTSERGMRAELQIGLAEAFGRLGHWERAVDPAVEAAESFRALGRPDDAARAGYWLAAAHLGLDNRAEARSVLDAARDDVGASPDADVDLRVRVLILHGSLEVDEHQYAQAIVLLEQALALGGDLDQRRRAALLQSVAVAHQRQGDIGAAVRSARDSLALFRAADARLDVSTIENQLALANLANGNIGRASELADRARARGEVEGDRPALARAAVTQARVALAQGQYAIAITLANEARGATIGEPRSDTAAAAMLIRARAEALSGNDEAANDSYSVAIDELRVRGPVRQLQEGLGEWAELLARAGRHEEAYALTREALDAPSHAPGAADYPRARGSRGGATTGTAGQRRAAKPAR